MNPLEAALADVAAFLDDSKIPYMTIGGMANLQWGRPRLTRDLDVTVQVPEASWPDFIDRLGRRFRHRAQDPLAFARETRVIPIETRSGIPMDLVLAGLPYEEAAIARAVPIVVANRPVRFCTAEDLILHKLASDRARDGEDVQGVIARQGPALDRGYLDARVRELARGLERPQILAFYRDRLREAGLEP